MFFLCPAFPPNPWPPVLGPSPSRCLNDAPLLRPLPFLSVRVALCSLSSRASSPELLVPSPACLLLSCHPFPWPSPGLSFPLRPSSSYPPARALSFHGLRPCASHHIRLRPSPVPRYDQGLPKTAPMSGEIKPGATPHYTESWEIKPEMTPHCLCALGDNARDNPALPLRPGR